MKNNNQGFTLVELAIVLVIIGLLVGGVLQGQELIKQSQVKSFVSQISDYDAALNTFRAKYREIPGDISKATNYGLDLGETSLTGATGENGNGDGKLQSVITAGSQSYDAYGGEISNFWVHLSYSKMVKGTYACAATAAATCATTLLPDTHFPSAGIGVGFVTVSSGTYLYYLSGLYSGFTAATGMTAASDATTGDSVLGLTMTPEEAFSIDAKIDDGKPLGGSVQSIGTYGGGGASINATPGGAGCASTTDYELTTANPQCSISIRAAL